MPKTYPTSRKERWLAQYSRGKTIKQIASKEKCDVRTVKSAIEEMRGRRAAQEAMSQLYQEAFQGHIDRLNSALDSIIEGLRIPDPYLTELVWHVIASSQKVSQGSGGVRKEESEGSGQDVLSDGALLAEHLKNSKAWRALGNWSRSVRKHRTACGRLQIRTFEVLKELTGLKAYEERDVKIVPSLHIENTGGLLCRTVVGHLSGGADIEAVTKEITVNDERGLVLHYTTVLAEGLKNVHKLSECKDNIIKSFKTLNNSSEAQQVLNTFNQLTQSLPKVRNELRALRLMGVIPGQCRVCHQFGL